MHSFQPLDLENRFLINIVGQDDIDKSQLIHAAFPQRTSPIQGNTSLFYVNDLTYRRVEKLNLCLSLGSPFSDFSPRRFQLCYIVMSFQNDPMTYLEKTALQIMKDNEKRVDQFCIIVDGNQEYSTGSPRYDLQHKMIRFCHENNLSIYFLSFEHIDQRAFAYEMEQSIVDAYAKIEGRLTSLKCQHQHSEEKEAETLKTYTKPYSGLLFGTHHKKRDKAFVEAFAKISAEEKDLGTLRVYELKQKLVKNQIKLMTEDKPDISEEEIDTLKSYLTDPKWLNKKPDNTSYKKSGFFAKLASLELDLQGMIATWNALQDATICTKFQK